MSRWIERAGLSALAITLVSCTGGSAKSHFIFAEKLWQEGNFAASVAEFEKVSQKEPNGNLGLMALYRAAMTETLYLGRHSEAVRKLRQYAAFAGSGPAGWEASRQIGEILFGKLEQHEQAITHYRAMLAARPGSSDEPEILFRIGKSHFFLWQFEEAISAYRELIRGHEASSWAERAEYEIGVALYTRGEHSARGSGATGSEMEVYQDAIDAYERFLSRHPLSEWAALARFGIASCLEEMDQLDAAYKRYQAIQGTFPSPQVIEVKLARLRERKAQKNR